MMRIGAIPFATGVWHGGTQKTRTCLRRGCNKCAPHLALQKRTAKLQQPRGRRLLKTPTTNALRFGASTESVVQHAPSGDCVSHHKGRGTRAGFGDRAPSRRGERMGYLRRPPQCSEVLCAFAVGRPRVRN